MQYKIIVFDMDGVIFRDENFWMRVHQAYDTFEEGSELTKKYLHTDYQRLVEEVVHRLWKGKISKPFLDLIASVEYFDGVKETFDTLNTKYKTAIISSSDIKLARRAQEDLGIDYVVANELVVDDDIIVGEFSWPIGAGKQEKVKALDSILKALGYSRNQAVFVGDSSTDIAAMKACRMSIAFNPQSQEVVDAADYVVNTGNLRDILQYIE